MPIPFSQTKAGRAHAVLQRLERGPSFSATFCGAFTPEEAAKQYRTWAQSWIVPEVQALTQPRPKADNRPQE